MEGLSNPSSHSPGCCSRFLPRKRSWESPFSCRSVSGPETDAAARSPHVLGRQAQGRDIGRFPLPGVVGGQPPEGIGEIVVDAGARRGEHLVEVRQEQAGKKRIVAGKAEKGPLLPEMDRLAGLLAVVAGGLLEEPEHDPLPVGHLPCHPDVAGAPGDGLAASPLPRGSPASPPRSARRR